MSKHSLWNGQLTGHRLGIRVSATLLNELHGTPQTELDSPMLSKKMYDLGANLEDLGLRDAALEVQTTVVVLCRVGGEMENLPVSLTCLFGYLSDLRRNEEALKASEEAVSIFHLSVTDRPKVFRPNLAHSLKDLSYSLWKLGRYQEMLEAQVRRL
jgi:hypothetical protein